MHGIITRKYEKIHLQETLRDLWQDLLEAGIVNAFLLPMKTEGDSISPGLLTDPVKKNSSVALSPYMPINTGRLLQTITKTTPPSEKLGAVLRPCEVRAAVELVKLKQISLENVIIFSIDCPGTYSKTDYDRMIEQGIDPVNDLLEKTAGGEDDENLRESCRACVYPVAPWSDVRIGFLGMGNELLIEGLTDTGKKILEKLAFDNSEIELCSRENFLNEFISRRKANEAFILNEQMKDLRGKEKLLSALSSCIGCRNCMNMCPICYCRECFFDSPTFEMEADRYMDLAKKRGAVRMPSDILLFHITRMTHMASSCVACGMCTEVCPMDVPVFKLFKSAGVKVQELLGYIPGISFEDPIPIATFKEDEMKDIEEPKI
jgi:formate dehydrogenase subunit beta